MLVYMFFSETVRGTDVPGGVVADLPDAEAQALVDRKHAAKVARGTAAVTVVDPAAAAAPPAPPAV